MGRGPPNERNPLVVPTPDGDYLVWEEYPSIHTNVRKPASWCVTEPDGNVVSRRAKGLTLDALREWLVLVLGATLAVPLVEQLNARPIGGVLASVGTKKSPFQQRFIR
jgi:hypothetical protein